MRATTCRGCAFQVLNRNGMQIGCFGQDISNEDLIDFTEPDFQFMHKVCQFKRDGLKGKTQREAWAAARQEVTLQYSAIAEFTTTEDALAFHARVNEQTLPPKLTIVCFRDRAEHDKFTLAAQPLTHRWRAIFIANPGDSLFKMVIPMVTTHFMWFANPSKLPRHSFWEELDRKVNDEGFRFTCIEGQSNIIMSQRMYKMNTMPFLELVAHLRTRSNFYKMESI